MSSFYVLFNKTYYLSILELTRALIKRQYKDSFLGTLWTVITPLMQTAIYAVIFSTLFKIGTKNHAYYIITGLLPWNFLQNSLMTCTRSLLDRGEVFKRCIVSKTIFPLADIFRNLYTMLFSFLCIYLIGLLLYVDFNLVIFLVPISLVPLVIFVVGIGVGLSYLTPYIRDVGEFISVGMMSLFYMTPIIYPIGMIPEKYQALFYLNPVYNLIKPFIDVVFYSNIPNIRTIMIALITSFLGLLFGIYCFSKLRKRVVFYM